MGKTNQENSGSRSLEMGKRYNQLRAGGMAGKEAADKINQEFRTALSYGAIRSYGNLAKKAGPMHPGSRSVRQEMELRAERDEGYEYAGPIEGHHEPSESYEHEDPLQSRDDRADQYDDNRLERRMKEIAREVFREMMNVQRARAAFPDNEPMPPEPETIKHEGRGRRENRKYERLTLTVDRELARLFKAEVKDRKLSAGKVMDAILWNRYGRPALSYGSPAEAGKPDLASVNEDAP